ncbi:MULTISPECIES: hypothetical protein [Legionella]|uniref:Uncharacterized protein n=1 Tax=Legionella donaldsonii TaxID=45060 RepID=A0A378JAB1_9GAMM|nr:MULTISPECIES: hypothetical protein [Legionella]MCC5014299.1 hypothetical protein [Legionella sp. 31fI33]STX44784.1 Uncharacterised protein [Legionella donaldsonii]
MLISHWLRAIAYQGISKRMLFLKISSYFKELRIPSFKIESENVDPETGLIYFWIQLHGKCTPLLKKDPIELLREARAKNFFSEDDYDRIIAALLENQKRLIEFKYKKKFHLIKHQFSEQLEQPLIVYNDSTNKIYIKPAKEIYSNIESLRMFSSEDSACIGNIVGSHETEQEFRIRKEAKKENVIKFDTLLLTD